MRSNSRRGVASVRHGSSPKIRAAIRPLVDALERRLLLSGTLPSFVQASTDASYTLNNSSGSMVMDLNSGSLVVTADLSTGYGWANATVRLHNGAHIYFNAPQTLGDLELHDTSAATAALANASTSGNPLPYGNFLQTNALAVDSTAMLDLGNNSMILYYAPSQEAADKSLIFGLLASGYNGGAWNGAGINSSAAATDSSHVTALGFADNYDLGDTNFDGITLSNTNQILIRYTIYGDTNLDGTINRTDSSAFSSGLDGVGTGWDYGDFNYDGSTTQPADSDLCQPVGTSITSSQYTPSLKVQALPFTAYGFAAWSGDIATFYNAAQGGSNNASDYTATVDWNDGTRPIDAQVYNDPLGDLRVNIDSAIPSDASVFTIRVSYALDGYYRGIGAAASASAVVTLDQLPMNAVASPDAIYTVSGVSGAMQIDVTAGTISFNTNLANDGNYWQNAAIDVSGSGHLIFNSAQTLGSLSIADNATVTVSQGSSAAAGNVLQLNSLGMDSTATLDLGDNSMILYYAPSDESGDLSKVSSLSTTGYNGGAWNGPGIDSSAAADDATHLTSLGYLDNRVGWLDANGVLQHHPDFAGVNLPGSNQVLVGYTLAGDANLDSKVDGVDANQADGQNGQGTGWLYGDFNYNGTVGDQGDFNILEQTSGKSIGDARYAPAFNLSPLPIQPDWNTPFDGDIATFTDTVNRNLPASDYVAEVYWGDGNLSIAQVTATSTPGSFRINAISPVFTSANPVMLVTLQYSADTGYQSESAITGEPIEVLQLPPGVNASANAVYSISGGPGDVQLNLTAGSLSFDANVSKDSNYFQNLSFTVSGSAHAYFNSPENFNNLTIQDNATVSISKGGGGTNGNLLDVQSLSIDPNATLDLADNALIDSYAFGKDLSTGATYESEASTQMSNWLTTGYKGGLWTGPGIDSSVAADDSTRATGIGWMDNGFDYSSISGLNPTYSSFLGVNFPTNNQLLVRFTVDGDANLNGQVDNSDVNLWHAGFVHSRTEWVYGNFNYDAQVDDTDLAIFDANFGLSTTSANYAPAFQPAGILINPIEGVPFSGDLATFTDLLNPANADPSIYVAQVNWGDVEPVAAQVTATSTPGSFRINAVSPPLTDPNAVMTVTIHYADMNDPSPTYQGRPAAVSEPITMTPAVSALTATAISTSEIDLTWTLSAPNASAIEVDRSPDGNDWETLTDGLAGNATSYADTSGLSEATHYFYRVSPIWSSGPSAFTNIADAWTLANAPSGLTKQVVSSNEIDLTWVNNSATATVFQIERSDDGTNFYPLDTSDSTSYADTSAGDGSTYTYRVEAINGGQVPSTPSNVVSGSTVLAPPSGLTATAVSASEIDLAWSDDSVTATGYEVDRSTDGVNFAPLAPSLPADASSYSDTGLSAGSHFYYHVISLASGQTSDPSSRADDTTTPPAPSSASSTATPSSATLTWSVAPGATTYEVDRSVNGNWVDVADIAGGSTTTFTDTGLLANTSFSYQVIAENNAGQSAPTPASATTPVAVPANPTGLQAIPLSPTSIELIWVNNADNEQYFLVEHSDDYGDTWSTPVTVPAGTNSYIDTSVLPDTYRMYRVFAHNSAGDSIYGYETWATTPSLPNALLTQPAAPSNLNAIPATGSISLTWTASTSPSVTYWVERQTPGGNWGVIARTGGTSFTDTPGLIGIDYSYRIVAVNALMASEPCTSVSAHRLLSPPLAPNPTDPWGVYVWNSGYKATIFWTPPVADVNDPVDGYNVYLNWGQGYVATQVSGADAHELTVFGSAANPQFQFYIKSFHKIDAQTTLESDPFAPDNDIIVLKNDPTSSGKITGASVDVNNGNHVNLTTSGTGSNTVNTVAYSDDNGTDFQGYIDASQLSINPGAKIWICNYYGDGSDLTEVDGPALPAVTGPTVTPGDSYYGGSLTWGGVISGATVQLEYKLNGIGGWTQVAANGGSWQQGSASLNGPDVAEGGSYTYQIRQTYNRATIPIAGNSDWLPEVAMGVAPFAPSQSTLTSTPISPTSAQLLWPEASEGETDELIQWSTNNFTTIAGSTTVGPDTTGYIMTSLTPNTNYSVRLAEQKSGAPDSLWSTGGVHTPAIESISIAAPQNASELGPDNHPQDGWFELTRAGLPSDSLTVSVDLSGTAELGSQYATGAGSTSPVQVTFLAGATAAMLEVDPIVDGLNDPPSTTVTATVETQAGITVAGGLATLNISELPTLGNVTVTGSTGGSTTAADGNAVDLYLAQPANGSEKITISGPPANSHILWSVAGSNNSSSGMIPNFGLGNPTIALKPWLTNYDFKVTVGVDKNGNGILDANEVQRTINVHVFTQAIVRVDANRDGTISFSPSVKLSDETGPSAPYKFWINDNSDAVVTSPDGNTDEVDGSGGDPDWADGKIDNARDLEDFARIEIMPPTGYSPAAGSGWSVSIGFDSVTAMAPGINLYPVQSTGTLYLTDPKIASAMVGETEVAHVGGTQQYTNLPVDPADFQAAGGELRYIFEGTSLGTGSLTVRFSHGGTVISQDHLNLQLLTVGQMYEHWTPALASNQPVIDTSTWPDLRDSSAPPIPMSAQLIEGSGSYGSAGLTAPSKTYVLFVHGWRMQPVERAEFANTAFKRLYWQGYTGHFGMFSWPTEWVDTSSIPEMVMSPANRQNYDRSEDKAYNSARALRSLLKALDSKYGTQNVDLVAHSMGNIVASEALRIEATSPNPKKLVHAYVASQAAVPAEAYDPSMSTRPANDPDIYAAFNPSGPPTSYFAAIGSAADRIVNFYNPVDYATSYRWVQNQTFKPDLGYETSTLRTFVRLGAGSDPDYSLNLNFAPDRYEAFAFGARAYSKALGAQAGVGGPIMTSAQVDLSHLSNLGAPASADFTDHQWDHSAQFNGTNMDRKYYWNLLMKAFGLTPWDPTQTTYPVLP